MAKRCSFSILLAVLASGIGATRSSNYQSPNWFHSRRVEQSGQWGSPDVCPKNSWVGGMRMKVDSSQEGSRALNAIELQCVNLNWMFAGSITSSQGRSGQYRKTKYCTRGFATGYRIRSEKITDFTLKCTNFDGSHGSTSYVFDSNNVLPWTSRYTKQECPPKMAVCGIITQLDTYIGNDVGNGISLNNIDLACCKIPDPLETCQLKTKWKIISVCSDVNDKCGGVLFTGFTEDKKLSKFAKFYENLGFIVDFRSAQNSLIHKAEESNFNRVNGQLLSSVISETKISKNTTLAQLNCEGLIQQLMVTCGSYKIYTKEYRCVPNGDEGKVVRVSLFNCD